MPRCSRFRSRISPGGTNAIPSSPAATPSPTRTRRASSVACATSTSNPLRFATSTSTTSALALRARALGVLPVGLDDPLHELVPHDVLVAEADERDPVERAEDVLNVDQARSLITSEVDLRDVAGDDDLRAEAETGQEH